MNNSDKAQIFKKSRLVAFCVVLVTTVSLASLFLPADAAAEREPTPEEQLSESETPKVELSIPSAVVLGLVEGFTEYLPVSSTGHLLVANEILGLNTTAEAEEALDTYAIGIQAGAILAVFLLYWERIREMFLGLVGKSSEGTRLLLAVLAAFIPTALLGLLYLKFVQDALFGALPIATAWLVGGIAILVLNRLGLLKKDGSPLTEITIRQAGIIGLAQAIAMWPGVSRSLVTIVAGVLVGLSVAAAVEFAFLLGLVTLGAATSLTAISDGPELVSLFGWASPLIGLVVAFLAALVSIKWMVSWLQERGLDIFGYYRVVIGLVAFAAIGAGWLS